MSDFFSGRSQGGSMGGLAGGLPSGVKLAAVALLVHQLMKHARSGSEAAPQPQESGGLGGVLGRLFGGGTSRQPQESGGPGGGLGGLLGGLLGGGAGRDAPADQAPGSWGGPPGGGQASGGQGGGGQGGALGSGPWGGQARGQAPGHAADSPMSQGGGAGGGLGGLLGAAAGGGLGGVLGGLGGLLGGLRQQGLGQHVESWVGTGQNQPVAPEELERNFDPQELDEAAQRAGTDRGTLMRELSNLLPQAVDRMTPRGQVPQRDEDLSGGLGGLLSSLLGGDPGQRPGSGGPGTR